MSLAQKVAALLESLTQNQVEAMSPADRQHLAGQCQRVLQLAQVNSEKPALKGGFVAELRDGRGRE
jgi:hypothetical protein